MNTPMRAVRINEALWERVQHTAEANHVSVSEAVRLLLATGLDAAPTGATEPATV